MKPAALTTMLFLFMASAIHAQFSLLPQIGFENAKTSFTQNDLFQFSPLGSKANFKASLRADYRFKGGHGPYLGLGTAPRAVQLNFSDPANAWKTASANSRRLQWKIETGYQYSFRPIQFKKGSGLKKSSAETHETSKRSCGSYTYKSKCGSKKTPPQQNTTLRLQPSVGLSYVPLLNDNVTAGNNGFEYIAQHSGFAITPAMGFEFGKGKNRIMTVTLQYSRSIGKQDKQAFQTTSNGKTDITSFSSQTSAWSLSAGIPFTIKKKASPSKSKVQKKSCIKKVYRSRCIKRI